MAHPGRHGVWCVLALGLASCTATAVFDTSEIDARIAALEQRIAKLEATDVAAELAQVKAQLASRPAAPAIDKDAIEQIAARKAEQLIRQFVQGAAAQPAPAPAPAPAAAVEQPRRPGDRPLDGPGDPAAIAKHRAEQAAARAGLTPQQTEELARILRVQQEKMAAAAREIREGKLPREQIRDRWQAMRKEHDAAIDGFKQGLTPDQAAKLDEALHGRGVFGPGGGPGARDGERPPRLERRGDEGKANEGGEKREKKEKDGEKPEKREKKEKDKEKDGGGDAPVLFE